LRETPSSPRTPPFDDLFETFANTPRPPNPVVFPAYPKDLPELDDLVPISLISI
jgi:hypothetical protein